MTTRIYVPNDTGARSVGADAVATAIQTAIEQAGLDARLVRNGSRGAYALEPLVEIDTDHGRIGFARVEPRHVATLFGGSHMPNARHPLCIGRVDDLPFLKTGITGFGNFDRLK